MPRYRNELNHCRKQCHLGLHTIIAAEAGAARGQGAKSFELRAVMSLSRLYKQQDKKEQAREILTEIYSWFTEGFDTADLKEARKLLDELSAQ